MNENTCPDCGAKGIEADIFITMSDEDRDYYDDYAGQVLICPNCVKHDVTIINEYKLNALIEDLNTKDAEIERLEKLLENSIELPKDKGDNYYPREGFFAVNKGSGIFPKCGIHWCSELEDWKIYDDQDYEIGGEYAEEPDTDPSHFSIIEIEEITDDDDDLDDKAAEIRELETALNICATRCAAALEDTDDPPTKEYIVSWSKLKALSAIQAETENEK